MPQYFFCRKTNDPVVSKLFLNIKTAEARFEYLYRTFKTIEGNVLRSMQYDEFLETVYWRITRGYLYSIREQICYRCGRNGLLPLHHLTYGNHGFEHLHLEDLVFLCRECHQEEHNPIAEIMKKLLCLLAKKEEPVKLSAPVENKDYDPRTLMNLRDYGDIRGRIHGGL